MNGEAGSETQVQNVVTSDINLEIRYDFIKNFVDTTPDVRMEDVNQIKLPLLDIPNDLLISFVTNNFPNKVNELIIDYYCAYDEGLSRISHIIGHVCQKIIIQNTVFHDQDFVTMIKLCSKIPYIEIVNSFVNIKEVLDFDSEIKYKIENICFNSSEPKSISRSEVLNSYVSNIIEGFSRCELKNSLKIIEFINCGLYSPQMQQIMDIYGMQNTCMICDTTVKQYEEIDYMNDYEDYLWNH